MEARFLVGLRMAKSIRFRVRAVVTVAVIVAILFLIAAAVRAINSRAADAYAAWWTSSLVTTYMEQHGGHWPRNWDDLAEAYEFRRTNGGVPFPFQMLKDRTDVDFDVDPSELLAHPRRVIRLKSGRTTHWDNAEPNEKVMEYLRSRTTTRPATLPARLR
jgi:hypothetical protein